MSKAYLAAKEKYQAVIDDAGRSDYYCRTNRFGASRSPSVGENHPINRIDHPVRRRSSSGVAVAIGDPVTIRERIRDWMNRPAY
ncbi:hypothetical protein HD806DRAFT_43453 [Xylariaceae sp. AK1471]|nr:hypothetical protein HD806DRAFT_43453 [Xylariaceae sp. AK1471]